MLSGFTRKRNMAFTVANVAILIMVLQVAGLDAQNTTGIASPSPSAAAVTTSSTGAATPSPVVGQMTTTVIVAAASSAVSQAIAPSATTAVAATASASMGSKFDTLMMITMVIEGSTCNSTYESAIENELEALYPRPTFHTKKVEISVKKVGDKCNVNGTVLFGEGLKRTDLVKVLKDHIKDDKIGNMTIVEDSVDIEVKVNGATTTSWKTASGECVAKCCKSGYNGESVTLKQNRTCTAQDNAAKCSNVPIGREKMFKNCDTCPTCSADTAFKFSMVMVFLSVLVQKFFL